MLEGARRIADFYQSLSKLSAVYSTLSEAKDNDVLKQAMVTHQTAAMDAFNKAFYEFQQAQLVISVVAGTEVQKAFLHVEKLLRKTSLKIVEGDLKVYSEALPQLRGYVADMLTSIRKELGIEAQGDPS